MAKPSRKLCLTIVSVILVALSEKNVNCDLELNKLLGKNANSTESCIAKYCSASDKRTEQKCNSDKKCVQNEYKIPADSLKHTSVLFGLFSVYDDAGLNKLCHKEMTQIYDGIYNRDIWAMKSKFIEIIEYIYDEVSIVLHA